MILELCVDRFVSNDGNFLTVVCNLGYITLGRTLYLVKSVCHM